MTTQEIVSKTKKRKTSRLEKLNKVAEKFEGKEYIYSVGKRKTSIAKVRLYKGGKGEFFINGKKYDSFFPLLELQTIMTAPLTLLGAKAKYNIVAYVEGGGIRGQSEAVCHGLARALVKEDEANKITLKKAGLITRDARQVERKKFGHRKARKSTQWSKR